MRPPERRRGSQHRARDDDCADKDYPVTKWARLGISIAPPLHGRYRTAVLGAQTHVVSAVIGSISVDRSEGFARPDDAKPSENMI